MAKFYKITSPIPHYEETWINIDTIVSMSYDSEADATYIFSCDDPNEHFVMNGNIINDILNANNELTMNDKNFANYIYNKFKLTLSSILAQIIKKGKDK